MDEKDKGRFLASLETVAYICRDPLDDLEQATYWLVLGPRCTPEEFESACLEVLATTKDHCVPMPGVFLEALEAVKERVRQEKAACKLLADEQARRREEVLRQGKDPDPRQVAAVDAAMRACMQRLEGILGKEWRTLADVQAVGERRTKTRKMVNAANHTDT